MTDIVEMLRCTAPIEKNYIVHLAAKEIERLRDQIKTVSAMNVKLVEGMEIVQAERDAAVKALRDIAKQPEGDEQSAQAIAKECLRYIDAARSEAALQEMVRNAEELGLYDEFDAAARGEK